LATPQTSELEHRAFAKRILCEGTFSKASMGQLAMLRSIIRGDILEGPFRHAERAQNGNFILRFITNDGLKGTIVRLANGKPARTVKAGFQERPTYRLASPKIRGEGEAESRLEADAYCLFDFDRTVEFYETQPFAVNYETGDRIVTTYPDTELKRTDDRFEIVQIKIQSTYEKHLRENPRFRGECEVFKRLGWSYRVMTEAEIRAEPGHSNRKLLRQYRSRVVAAPIVESLLATLRRYPGAKINEIIEAFRIDGLHEVDIYSLIARNVIQMDPDQPIGPETRLIAAS
jgi:hypothetical protein